RLSTQMCRLRPLTFLPLSKPLTPPCGVVLTDWLSAADERGLGSRPACRRTCWRSASLMRSQVPSVRPRRRPGGGGVPGGEGRGGGGAPALGGGGGQGEDGVEGGGEVGGGPAHLLGARQKRLDQRELFVGEVGVVRSWFHVSFYGP